MWAEEAREMWTGEDVSFDPLGNHRSKIQSIGSSPSCRSSLFSSVRGTKAPPEIGECKMVTQLTILQSLREDTLVPEREQTRSKRKKDTKYVIWTLLGLQPLHNSL